MTNPYERRARVFTPEVIAELARVNKEYREKKYPFLRDYVPAPNFDIISIRRMK